LAKQDFHAENGIVTLLLAGFAVGVGGGSILAGRLLRGEISARHVPFASLLLSGFTFGFAYLAGRPGAAEWVKPAAMLASRDGKAALACLLGAAACGGVFSVPLYAILQDRAEPGQRARMVAANNVLNAAFMVVGAGVIAGLAAIGMRPASVLMVTGGLNLLVAGLVSRPATSLAPKTS